MIRDDVNYFDSLYCSAGSYSLQLNVNWPHAEKPVVMKLACEFTDEEKSEYIMRLLDTRESERKRISEYLARKREATLEEIKASVAQEHLMDKRPGNYWWGVRPKKRVEIGSYVTGKI